MDHSRDEHGRPRARLLDLVPGRTGAAYGDWLAEQGTGLVAEILDSFPSCRIPEIARLGRTLRRWRAVILAYFDTDGASNGPTEAVNGVIETMRRVARRFHNFENYRLRALLAAGGHSPWRKTLTHTQL